MNSRTYYGAAIIGIGLIIVGVFVFRAHSTPNPLVSNATSSPVSLPTSTSTLPQGAVLIPGTDMVITEPQPQKVSTPEPDLNRPFPNTANLDPVFVSRIKSQLSVTISNLRQNSTSFQDWIDLGYNRKELSDYEGARQAWVYAGLLYPKNTISFANLGDLYANYLHDVVQAEQAYTIALTNNPTQAQLYTSLADLYQKNGNTSAMLSTLIAGANKNPQAFEIDVILARYWAPVSTTTAHIWYDKAISQATLQQKTSVVTSLQAEENALQ